MTNDFIVTFFEGTVTTNKIIDTFLGPVTSNKLIDTFFLGGGARSELRNNRYFFVSADNE
jgi:hypothetical protein